MRPPFSHRKNTFYQHFTYPIMCDSFSSSVFNHRTDEYGGSAENRARFAVEAVRAVYRQSSEIPIDYKLTVRQAIPLYGSADVVESEPGIFVPILVEASVTSFHVTLANHSGLEDTILSTNRLYFKAQVHFLKFVIRFCSILISLSLMLAG